MTEDGWRIKPKPQRRLARIAQAGGAEGHSLSGKRACAMPSGAVFRVESLQVKSQIALIAGAEHPLSSGL